MRANGIVENSWIKNVDDYFAPSRVTSEKFDMRTRVKSDDNSIRRDEFGTIDFTYYAARAEKLRSESTFSFFKALVYFLKYR